MRVVDTAPERFGAVGLAVAGAAAVWPTFTDVTGVGLPCPLRAATGVPCPLCGMTRASVSLVRGDVGPAVALNPLVIVLAVFTALMVGVVVLRRAGFLGPPRPWPRGATGPALVAVGALAALSEAWQLHRL